MKKDKVKILDEVLSEERIKEFLSLEPPATENVDFHRLQKAYRGMPPQYFEIFIELFKEQGGDISAPSKNGTTFIESIKNQKHAQAYIDILVSSNA